MLPYRRQHCTYPADSLDQTPLNARILDLLVVLNGNCAGVSCPGAGIEIYCAAAVPVCESVKADKGRMPPSGRQ